MICNDSQHLVSRYHLNLKYDGYKRLWGHHIMDSQILNHRYVFPQLKTFHMVFTVEKFQRSIWTKSRCWRLQTVFLTAAISEHLKLLTVWDPESKISWLFDKYEIKLRFGNLSNFENSSSSLVDLLNEFKTQ